MSTSTRTGVAPVAMIAATVASAVCETVMTSSPCADAERAQGEDQRVGAAADTDRMGDSAIIGKCTLEIFDFAAKHIGAAVEDPANRGIDRGFVRPVLRSRRSPGDHEITFTSGT